MIADQGPLVECVPNFSEGRRPDVLTALVEAVKSVAGVRLLNHSADPDHNRAVFTFVGAPEPLLEAAFRIARTAVERIDMEHHQGQHPRIGAVDVVPFVPIAGVGMEDCVRLAERMAERLWGELGVPVYLYGKAARRCERVHLPDVRRGQYEGLKENIKRAECFPDVGEPRLHPTAGAAAVGAREPLVAFNINLRGANLAVAKRIARAVRESSGGLVHLQARGMWMDSRGLAQVSMNLLDYRSTPLYRAFELVRVEAERFGAVIASSELIELLPLDAVLETFSHYLRLDSFGRGQVLEWRLLEEES
ncbi:MAG: glutamate formimidoyltransferase [Coprothermobacterota bacterium]|nr:glutamate formimidoyltransferase [Coprothermobacterota bacterium]